ncbi:hypothetical protein Tco_0874436 [Tanacetum coccineum]|uniref:Xylulose kinase-1 n=1 Tax=Tanacetum coccineum TaxID=301880 RepID=A0ABQ5BLL2_9ASTR
MSTLTFVDTHNMVVFLEKPAKSDEFHEIIDFLNANQIRYALTVNPTIYTSCIEQFWATAKAKTINGERQIQALIDKKKVIITETSIRSDLHLEYAGVSDPLHGMNSVVLDLEKAKDAQAKEIADLKKRVQKLERKKKSRPTGLKRLKKVGMSRRVKSYKDKETLGDHEDASKQGRRIEDIDKDVDQSEKEREVDASVKDSATPTTIEEITLAQTLIQIKAAKPKVVTTPATTTTTTRPKARGVVVHEPKKDQAALDEDLARNLQAQLEAELIEE